MSFFIRTAERNDTRFIRKHWLASARSGFAYRNMRDGEYTRGYARVIDRLLERSLVLVVADKDNPHQRVGFLVAELPTAKAAIVHFVYVSYDWRLKGIAKALSVAAGLHEIPTITSTHDNTTMQQAGVPRGINYNPLLIWPELFEAKEAA